MTPPALTLGDISVRILSDGTFALDGGALFGIVPRTLWERTNPPDDRNRITLGLNVTLVETAGPRILVDTGIGDKWNAKERERYRIDRSQTLLSSLAELGLRPEDIDIVVNTHLHFDHCGGNTRFDGDKVVPTFPKARYVVQMGEWEDATHPHERNRASYVESNFLPIAEAQQLRPVQGTVEIAPGVKVVPVGGHTPFHQMIVVEGGGTTVVVPSDVLPTASHIPLAYVTGFDLFPLGSLAAKKKLLAEAVAGGHWIVFYHDPKIPLGQVRRENGSYALVPAAA